MNHGPGSSYMLAANEKINQLKQQGQSPDQVHATMLDAVKNGLLPFTVAVQALKQYSDPMQVPPQFPKPGSVVGDLLAANNQRQTGVANMPNPAMANAQFAGGITGEQAAPQGMANGGIVAFYGGGDTPDDPYGVYADSPVFKYFKPSIDAAIAERTAAGNPDDFRAKSEQETEDQFKKYGIGNFDDREARIAEREARLAKQEKNAGLDAFIKGAFGMAAAGARPGATFLGAAAEGANQGFEAYGAGKDKIELAKQAVADARDRLADAQQAVKLGKMSASSKAYDRLVARYDAASANLRNVQLAAGKDASEYARAQLSANAQERVARIYGNNKNKNETAFETEIDNARRLLSERRRKYPANSPLVIEAEKQLNYWNNQRAEAMRTSSPAAYGHDLRNETALTIAESKDPIIPRLYGDVVALGQRIEQANPSDVPKLRQKLAQAQAALDEARAQFRRKNLGTGTGIDSPAAVEAVPRPEGTIVREASDYSE